MSLGTKKKEQQAKLLRSVYHIIYLTLFSDYMRKQSTNSAVSAAGGGSGGSGYTPRSGYDELDTTLMPPRPGEPYNRGSPGNSNAGSMSGSQSGGPAVTVAAAASAAAATGQAAFQPAQASGKN